MVDMVVVVGGGCEGSDACKIRPVQCHEVGDAGACYGCVRAAQEAIAVEENWDGSGAEAAEGNTLDGGGTSEIEAEGLVEEGMVDTIFKGMEGEDNSRWGGLDG